MITYSEVTEKHFESWLNMAHKLWKDAETSALRAELKGIFNASNQKTIIAEDENNAAIGFVTISIRTDYVTGAKKSPTGYLEGIFVEAEKRKQGIGTILLRLGEEWLLENDCTQIGSDTWLTNTESQKFHKKVGFREEEKLVHFIKEIT